MPGSLKRGCIDKPLQLTGFGLFDSPLKPERPEWFTSSKIPTSTYRKKEKPGYFSQQSISAPAMRENLSIEGVNIYYKGNIGRGAVVFLHGNSLNALVFREQFSGIDAFPMLAIDLPGHGCSDKAANGEQTYNIPAYARMVAGIIEELELADVILAGHAMGGNVAIEAAELLPELKGLFLFNMSPFSRPPQLDKMCKANPFLSYLLSGRLTWRDALAVAGEMLQHNHELAEFLAQCIMQADGSARLGFAASLGLDKFRDEFRLLRHFEKPLAMVQGKTDRFINHSYLNSIDPVTLWKNGIIKLEAGHIPQMEIPAEFNKLIEEFYRYALEEGNERKKDRNCANA